MMVFVLTAIWIATAAWSGTAITPAMHCGHGDMQCCPHRDGRTAHCSPVQCMEQVPLKTESRPILSKAGLEIPPNLLTGSKSFPGRSTDRVATKGLRLPAAVFRLKGELRI